MKSNQDKQLKQSIGGDIQIQINIDKKNSQWDEIKA